MMKKLTWKWIGTPLLVLLALGIPTSALPVGQVGDLAAGYHLEDTWGNWHDLQNDLGNKVVLLNMMGST